MVTRCIALAIALTVVFCVEFCFFFFDMFHLTKKDNFVVFIFNLLQTRCHLMGGGLKLNKNGTS